MKLIYHNARVIAVASGICLAIISQVITNSDNGVYHVETNENDIVIIRMEVEE